MTSQHPIIPVRLDAADPGSCERHRAALATLPACYAVSDSSAGGAAVVSSAGNGWAERAIQQLENGALAVLIVIGDHLDMAGLDAVELAARASGATVAADLEFAADPAWAHLVQSADLGQLDLIDGLAITSGSPRAAAIRLLVTLAVALPVLPEMEALVAAPDHLVLGSTSGSAPVTLAVTYSAFDGSQRLDLVAKAVRYEISWPERPRAAPALLYTHSVTGTARAALSYEAPERGLWQRLHADLGHGHGEGVSLGCLRAALESVPFAALTAPS
jgi:hypothetical protein